MMRKESLHGPCPGDWSTGLTLEAIRPGDLRPGQASFRTQNLLLVPLRPHLLSDTSWWGQLATHRARQDDYQEPAAWLWLPGALRGSPGCQRYLHPFLAV